MKITLAAAALLSLAVPTAAWTAVPLPSTTVRSSPLSRRNPSHLQVGILEDGDAEEVASAKEVSSQMSLPLNLDRKALRAVSLITTVAGAVVTLAATCTQPVMSLSGGSIPSTVAWIITLGIAYAANSIGLGGGFFIGFTLLCFVSGIFGSPMSFFEPAPPEPQVKMVDPSSVEEVTEKSLVARTLSMIIRLPFQIILVILAITDTILSTTFMEEGKDRRNWFWDLLFDEEEQFLGYEEVYGGEVVNDHPDELWIYINGIGTDLEAGKNHCKNMYDMFGRPVKLMHNPTDSFVLDLFECLMGKTGLLRHCTTGPRKFILQELEEEMKKDYKKIVLVAHSQGTIITGNVIADFNDIIDGTEECSDEERALIKDNMSKMEVYLVASAAHYVNGKYVSNLECLSNRGDPVAVAGHLYPEVLKRFWFNTRGAGMLYNDCIDQVEKASWGHMMEPHYLIPMQKGAFSGSKLVTSYLSKKPQEESASETSELLP
mmetsp:Transcript_28323/g.42309  ORF Transcript_28323/g.42309 Transcript_28323/m.42309 type:complete len:488 (-) Transcript_28323:307-1770(-)